MSACVTLCIKVYSCVCLRVIMLLACVYVCVQTAQTADGFNACGRLMSVLHVTVSGRETYRGSMSGCVWGIQAYDPIHPAPPPNSNLPSLHPVPPVHPTHISTHPCLGQNTMFSPRLACHLLAQDVSMDMISQSVSNYDFT